MKKWWLLLPIIFGSLIWLLAYRDDGKVAQVQVVSPERGELTANISAVGRIVSEAEVAIASPISARVRKIYATEGALVKVGDLLLAFDTEEPRARLAKAQLSLDLTDQRHAQAERELSATRTVQEAGGASQQAVDNAHLKVEETLAEQRQWEQEVRLAKLELERYALKSELSGVVTLAAPRSGQWIRSGEGLFRLVPKRGYEIEIHLNEADSAQVQPGMSATVLADAYPRKPWAEQVTWVAPAATKEGQLSQVRARLSLGADAPSLILGQQVEVKIASLRKAGVLHLLSSVLGSERGRPYVTLLRDGRLVRVAVTTGIEDGTRTEIVDGIGGADQVVVPDGRSFAEGTRVHAIALATPASTKP